MIRSAGSAMGWGGGQQWQEMGARPSRPFDTVVLDEGMSFDGLLLRGILGHLPTASKSKQPHAHFVCRFHAIPMCCRQSNHITISLSRKRFFTIVSKRHCQGAQRRRDAVSRQCQVVCGVAHPKED